MTTLQDQAVELVQGDGYAQTDELRAVDAATVNSDVRPWVNLMLARGYVEVECTTESAYESWIVHPATSRVVHGEIFDGGVNLSLWDDFFNGFQRSDFDTTEAYLDAVESRFATLWTTWDEG